MILKCRGQQSWDTVTQIPTESHMLPPAWPWEDCAIQQRQQRDVESLLSAFNIQDGGTAFSL